MQRKWYFRGYLIVSCLKQQQQQQQQKDIIIGKLVVLEFSVNQKLIHLWSETTQGKTPQYILPGKVFFQKASIGLVDLSIMRFYQ